LAHLLDENRRVGLKDLASIMYGDDSIQEAKEMRESVARNGGSLTKDNHEMYKADTELMGKYGAKDALLTYKLFLDLVPQLYEQNLDKFFYEDESMPLLRGPTYELNTTGINIDTKALITLKKTLEAECAEAKSFIHQEIHEYIKDKYPGTNKKNTFNIGGSQQLSWLLFGKLGLEFGTLTKGGKNICKTLGIKLPYTAVAKRNFIAYCQQNVGTIIEPECTVNGKKKKAKKLREPWCYIGVDKRTLAKLSTKHKWIARLLEYQRKLKLLNTYVCGIEERISYGVIRPNYLQHGTVTGRYASRNPNLQNLPRDDQRVKECFVARPGKVFVSADFSQLEPRTFAFYSKDPRLMAAFDGTSDFYSVVGREVYGKYDSTPQKDGSGDAFGVKYKKLRDQSKTIALAAAYGATPHQLSPTTGKSVDETAEDMAKYFEAFPGVRKMMLEAHGLVKENGYVTNLFGRVRRIPEGKRIHKLYGNSEHWDLPYEARKLLNMACNFRIQSTGASIVNRSAIKFNENCKLANIDCKLVSQIHDELVVECAESDAGDVSVLLQEAMETTVLLDGVKLEAIPRISKNLAK
jgi:DNA polymerase I-like protein with 3'-5' exonuclease and polymerase domains